MHRPMSYSSDQRWRRPPQGGPSSAALSVLEKDEPPERVLRVLVSAVHLLDLINSDGVPSAGPCSAGAGPRPAASRL